eukprot:m.254816 g.254816  ORF g.254816 m.254816 type:complete len:285 (-) comp19171_c0_seq1:273-1127(-)
MMLSTAAPALNPPRTQAPSLPARRSSMALCSARGMSSARASVVSAGLPSARASRVSATSMCASARSSVNSDGMHSVIEARMREQHVQGCIQVARASRDAELLDDLSHLLLNEYGEPETAIRVSQAALGIRALAISQPRSRAMTYNLLGNAYFAKGEPAVALQYHNKALVLVQSSCPEDDILASIYRGIGLVHKSYGDAVKSVEFFKKELEVHLASNNTESAAAVYSLMGDMYDFQGMSEAARECDRKALELQRTLGDKSLELASLDRLHDSGVEDSVPNTAEAF